MVPEWLSRERAARAMSSVDVMVGKLYTAAREMGENGARKTTAGEYTKDFITKAFEPNAPMLAFEGDLTPFNLAVSLFAREMHKAALALCSGLQEEGEEVTKEQVLAWLRSVSQTMLEAHVKRSVN